MSATDKLNLYLREIEANRSDEQNEMDWYLRILEHRSYQELRTNKMKTQ